MDETVRFLARPEAHLLNRPADTGDLSAEDALLYSCARPGAGH